MKIRCGKGSPFLSQEDITARRPDMCRSIKTVGRLYRSCDDSDIHQGFMGVDNDKIKMLFADAHMRGQEIGKELLHYTVCQPGTKFADANKQNTQGWGYAHRV